MVDEQRSMRGNTAGNASGGARIGGPSDASAHAVLNGSIDIFPAKKLPQFDKGPLKAYAARQKGDDLDQYFALICEPHLIPRSEIASTYQNITNPSLVRLVSFGPVFWPPANAARFCFVYQNSLGKSIITPQEQGLGWRPDLVLKSVIKPMVNVLSDLRDRNIFHGAIRPANMFDGGEKNIERVILGDCLSLPPSYAQSVVFEPLNRGMRDPIGKGNGTEADDLYAFGVSLAVILRKKDPWLGKTDREILQDKFEIGSFAAILGRERITGPLVELLRGLLHDDREQRWTLNEIMGWLEGQHPNTKQSMKKKKATRPLDFNKETYERPIFLAMDLYKSSGEAVQIIEGGALDQWITRSLEDTTLKTRTDEAIEAARSFGRGVGYNERLISRVAVALDPDGPVRYRDLNVHPAGFVYALAEAVALRHDLQPFAEIINQQIMMYWLTAQVDLKQDNSVYLAAFDTCRSFLKQNSLGYGIERCLYFLNSEVPCMSDRLRNYYVRTPEDFLYALEAISRLPGRPEFFVDRHIAAFLSIKDKKIIDPFAPNLNAAEVYKRILGNIKVVTAIQKMSRMENFPGISNWMATMVEPLYSRFHDRDLRARQRKKMEKLKDVGELNKIVALFDDFEMKQNDTNGFLLAVQEYKNLDLAQIELEQALQQPEQFSRHAAQETAAIVSTLIAILIIAGFCLAHFMQ